MAQMAEPLDPKVIVPGFIKGLEKIKTAESPLTDEQKEEQDRIVQLLVNEHDKQKDEQTNRSILRKRNQFVHLHGTMGAERAVDTVIAFKGKEMADHGMNVHVLNLNFLKRLQTRALYVFLKEKILENDPKAAEKVHLKIQEEDADEEDILKMMEYLQDLSEDAPLFVITDETCKEPERIDDAIKELTRKERRFHFWSSSGYAHGTPDSSQRYRLATERKTPHTIKQVMDMIDIDDDDVDITGPHHIPLRRVIFPYTRKTESAPGYNIREHLDILPVRLISHSKTHLEPDVWECEKCGKMLADYLDDEIGLGQQSKRYAGGQAGKAVTRWKTDKQVSIDEKSHMNYLPVPQGSWYDHFKARNSKWEMMLGGSIAFFFATVFVANEFRVWYFHGSPVPCPGSPPDAKRIGYMHPQQRWH